MQPGQPRPMRPVTKEDPWIIDNALVLAVLDRLDLISLLSDTFHLVLHALKETPDRPLPFFVTNFLFLFPIGFE